MYSDKGNLEKDITSSMDAMCRKF